MSAIESIWHLFMVMACLLAIINPRKAIFLGILIDALRDPVRKLAPMQPVSITLSGAAFWVVIVIFVAASRRRELASLYRAYPRMKTALMMLLLALLPAAGVAIISYTGGWKLAAIGGVSYIVPAIGILCGFALLKHERDVHRMMRTYVFVNSLMLISVPLEYLKFDLPALGGIDFEWIRHRQGYTVNLMCGWYRSPDIMGLHAAHVMMFAIMLASLQGKNIRAGWLIPVVWAGFCVLLSGRRKMIGIPLVFVAAFLACGMAFRIARINRVAGVSVAAALTGVAMTLFFWSPAESQEYTDFAKTLFTEGVGRANELVIGSTLGTLQQAGIIGGGLGTATQGRYYANVQSGRQMRGWQEDGVSRLFLEFGVPGVVLLLLSLAMVLSSIRRAIRMMPPRGNLVILQIGMLSVVVGDTASYAISHQQFSGDPVSGLLVTIFVGMILRFPLMQPSGSRLSASATVPLERPQLSRLPSA